MPDGNWDTTSFDRFAPTQFVRLIVGSVPVSRCSYNRTVSAGTWDPQAGREPVRPQDLKTGNIYGQCCRPSAYAISGSVQSDAGPRTHNHVAHSSAAHSVGCGGSLR